MLRKPVFFFLILLCGTIHAQDSIPLTQSMDSTKVDTIVIRTIQEKIKNIPRGANLIHPVVSFNQTKPLTNKLNRFKVPSFWEKENKLDLKLSEVAFVNWNAGGDNSISALGNIVFARNYKFRYVQWNNDLRLKYGINAQEGRKIRKTNDEIRLSSTFGYRKDTLTNWYYSVKANLIPHFPMVLSIRTGPIPSPGSWPRDMCFLVRVPRISLMKKN